MIYNTSIVYNICKQRTIKKKKHYGTVIKHQYIARKIMT